MTSYDRPTPPTIMFNYFQTLTDLFYLEIPCSHLFSSFPLLGYSFITTTQFYHNHSVLSQPLSFITTTQFYHNHSVLSQPLSFITTTQFYHNHSVLSQPLSFITTTSVLSQPLSICIVFSSLSAIVIVQCYTLRYRWISL